MKKADARERFFEREMQIRTAGRDAASEDAHRLPYEPTPYAVLEKLADSGWIGPDNLLVDMGCGKGRVSLFLSRVTGCRSIGVDFNPDMIAAAEENLASVKGSVRVSFAVGDAERYDPPADADRFYFFNPFSAEILRSALARIAGSWYGAPRRILLFFYYPSDEYIDLLNGSGALIPAGAIDCSDLFPGDRRETILCFELPG